MRKIISKYEAERIRRRNSWAVGGVLVFLMLFSTLGYAFQGSLVGNVVDENPNGSGDQIGVTYNGFEFIQQGSFWRLNNDNVNLVFSYNPDQVGNSVRLDFDASKYSGKELYIYSENSDAKSEIKRNLFPFVTGIEDACLQGELCEDETLPIKTCDENMIVIRESSENRINWEGDCVFILGEGENLIKLVDEFLFNILGIK